jgi:hypothetical protein
MDATRRATRDDTTDDEIVCETVDDIFKKLKKKLLKTHARWSALCPIRSMPSCGARYGAPSSD